MTSREGWIVGFSRSSRWRNCSKKGAAPKILTDHYRRPASYHLVGHTSSYGHGPAARQMQRQWLRGWPMCRPCSSPAHPALGHLKIAFYRGCMARFSCEQSSRIAVSMAKEPFCGRREKQRQFVTFTRRTFCGRSHPIPARRILGVEVILGQRAFQLPEQSTPADHCFSSFCGGLSGLQEGRGCRQVMQFFLFKEANFLLNLGYVHWNKVFGILAMGKPQDSASFHPAGGRPPILCRQSSQPRLPPCCRDNGQDPEPQTGLEPYALMDSTSSPGQRLLQNLPK